MHVNDRVHLREQRGVVTNLERRGSVVSSVDVDPRLAVVTRRQKPDPGARSNSTVCSAEPALSRVPQRGFN
jgi:hypothetical protein